MCRLVRLVGLEGLGSVNPLYGKMSGVHIANPTNPTILPQNT